MASILHVLPADAARGAQVGAAELVTRLGEIDDHTHVAVTLFTGPVAALAGATRLDVPVGLLRRGGFDPRAARRLRRTASDLDAVALVAHGSEPLKYAVLARTGVPIAYHRIGLTSPAARHGWRQRVQRALVGRADLVVCISDEVRADVVGVLGVQRERTVVIENGRDPDVYRPVDRSARSGPTELLFVGTLVEGKRPGRFAAAVDVVRSRGVDVHGSAAGGGPLLDELRRTSRGGVTWLGVRDDVPALLREADVFVFTGEPMEGMPGVLVEAALAGLPIVTTDVPGGRAVVADQETGFVVPPGDDDALCDAIERLALDAGLRARMGQAARERAVDRFSSTALARRWREALAAQISPSSRR